MRRGFSLDLTLELGEGDEDELIRLGRDLGYESAWTPANATPVAFERCARWFRVAGLPTGISVVPAHAVDAVELAARARHVLAETGDTFTLGVGSGALSPAATAMRGYLGELRPLMPEGAPLFVAAMGPRMLELAGRLADGAMLNWGSADRNAFSAQRVRQAAAAAGRPVPTVMSYVRVCVDPDPDTARRAAARAMLGYAIGPPAYRALFAEMGFEADLERLEQMRDRGADLAQLADAAPAEMVRTVCAFGSATEVRAGFERIGTALDLAVVRVVNARPADPAAARAALEACRPG